MTQIVDPTFYRSPADAVAAPPAPGWQPPAPDSHSSAIAMRST